MNERKLPIIRPDVHGYLCNAYPLSIAMQHSKSEAWFYSNYIQLICAGNFPEGKFFSFYTSNLPWYDFFLSCPLINYQKINQRFLEKYEGGLIRFICDSIDQNQYIHLYVDESYISHKKAYKKNALPHEMLIFGYNKENSSFHVSGYNSNVIFGEYEVTFEEFLLAFNNCDKTKNREYICLLAYNEEHNYHFDLELVIQSLKELRYSLNSSYHYRSMSPPSNWIFGLSIYDHIIKYLDTEVNFLKEKIDFRIFHTLWEHKGVMLNRLKYLKEHHYLNDADELIKIYSEIESDSLILRNMAMMYNLNENSAIITSITEKMTQIKSIEEAALSRLISQLESVEKSEKLLSHYYL
ncbi:hypothetical protein [Paenibacillus medicaginis]|uniref:Butirosin biosynthesis protein H N-terminal domain-containing protein n=1 Tax=Paenibacillus medicaginis TaxID=1470560 RepID=A0ABV5C7T9_9BACL